MTGKLKGGIKNLGFDLAKHTREGGFRMRKGFTLLELLIVVIVIGVLAGIAVPQFLNSVEKAKIAKAQHALGLIAQAEKMYRAEHDVYTTAIDPDLDHYVEMTQIQNDPDWDYSVIAIAQVGAAPTFTLQAMRQTGSYTGQTILLDQDGVFAGTHTLLITNVQEGGEEGGE